MSSCQRWTSAARTHVGHMRRSNEDAILQQPAMGLWAVADGLGGHANGALASRLAVDRLAALKLQGPLAARVALVEQCLQETNHKLACAPTCLPGHRPVIYGSTIVALLATPSHLACLWAGDSRCYLWRDRQLFLLTRDHSVQNRQLRGVSRALGAAARLEVDSVMLPLCAGDTLLLCSDGLYQDIQPERLARALCMPLASLAIDSIFQHVLAGRATDNLSAVVVRA